MTSQPPSDITLVLNEMSGEDSHEVLDELFPMVYNELRTLARSRLRRERPDHSLQTTALVHEAYLRMLGGSPRSWNDRQHFFRAAAQAMRRILVEHARRRGRIKRGGGARRVTLGEVTSGVALPLEDVLALDEALQRLEEQDTRMAEVVHLRFFAGLSVEETAQAMNVSERTVKREWAVARAWLYDALRDSEEATG